MKQKLRVFLGSIATETNTFSPLRTDLIDFKDSFYAPPGEHPDTPTLCSAVFPAARAVSDTYGWDLIEGTATWAEPGGIINQQCWEFLYKQLLEELKAAMPVDIVLLGLHGAMVAQDCLDCEGVLLSAIREIVGPDVVVGATFDPHSHLSMQRIQAADILINFKEFPHTDFCIVAENLCELANKAARGEIKPKMSVFDCRMIEVLPTSHEPMRGFVDHIKSLEGKDNVLSISVVHGFMAGDVPDLGAKMLVITDDDIEHGEDLASDLGMQLFGFRGIARPDFQSPSEVLSNPSLFDTEGPVVIADVWDNPGGGVPGDSTILLREIMAQGIKDVAVATIWDPIAVRLCQAAGEGAMMSLRFGGKTSPGGGDPIDAVVKVEKIEKDAWQSFGDSKVPLGESVVISFDGIEIILNSNRCQAFEPNIFSNLGIDPKQKRLLVVKSTNHFYEGFARIAKKIIYVAVSGPYPDNPLTNNYKNLTRPVWPLVENPHE